LQFARLFAKLPRPVGSELIFAVFELSCLSSCYYQFNHSKVPSPRTQQANLPTYLHTTPF